MYLGYVIADGYGQYLVGCSSFSEDGIVFLWTKDVNQALCLPSFSVGRHQLRLMHFPEPLWLLPVSPTASGVFVPDRDETRPTWPFSRKPQAQREAA